MLALVQLRRPICNTIRTSPKLPQFMRGTVKLYFSSGSNDEMDSKGGIKAKGWNIVLSGLNLAQKNTGYIAIGGGVLIALGITRGLYGMAHSFLTLTPYQAMYYGFVGGIISTGTVATIIHFSERAFHINPDRAVHAAMKTIYKNNEIKAILGGGLQVGGVKTFTSTSGGFGIRKGVPAWVSPEIQAAFLLQGSAGEALATIVYNKTGMFGKEVLSFVGLEWIDPNTGNPVTLTLKGDPDRFVGRGTMKTHAAQLGKKYLKS